MGFESGFIKCPYCTKPIFKIYKVCPHCKKLINGTNEESKKFNALVRMFNIFKQIKRIIVPIALMLMVVGIVLVPIKTERLPVKYPEFSQDLRVGRDAYAEVIFAVPILEKIIDPDINLQDKNGVYLVSPTDSVYYVAFLKNNESHVYIKCNSHNAALLNEQLNNATEEGFKVYGYVDKGSNDLMKNVKMSSIDEQTSYYIDEIENSKILVADMDNVGYSNQVTGISTGGILAIIGLVLLIVRLLLQFVMTLLKTKMQDIAYDSELE